MARRRAVDRVAALEAELGLALPDEYAAYVRGGGPSGGGSLLTPEQAIAHERPRLEQPFPFDHADVARVVAARARGERLLLEPADTVGSVLVIADGGCGDLTHLVLAGPLRGSVWSSADEGWAPHVRSDGTLLGLRAWLDEVADEPAEPATPAKAATRARPAKKSTRRVEAPPLVIDRAAYQLNLRGRGLSSLPEEVAEMTKVRMVYLGGNALTALPAPLVAVAGELLALELGPNPLASLDDGAIARFTRLTQLDLRETTLTRLPEALDRLPLRELTLHGNPQLDVAQALSVAARIPTLRWLTLSACELREVPAGVLALRQLERLYLGGNPIETLPPELATLQLELLGLIDCRIDRIPDVLEPRVRSVYFAGNPGARAEKKRFDAVRRGFVMLG